MPFRISAIFSLLFILLSSQVHAYSGQFIQSMPDTSEYCKTVTICGSAPKEFTLIMDFSRELLNAIKTIGTQGDYLGKYVNPNWFQGDTFAPPAQNIIDKGVRNVGQELDFLLADTAIFTSPQQGGGIKDLLAGVIVLFKNDVFARDLKVVEALDSSVTQKRYELGLGGGRLTKVNDANVKKLQQIITTYQHKGLLTSSSSISQGVLYNNITALVGRIDTAMKSFLALDNIDQFNTWTKGGDNGISITFSGALMASMQRQYSCARGSSTVSDTGEVITNICDKNSQQLNANMDKISNDAKASIAASRKKIDDAFIRLKSVITSSWSDMFTLSKHSQVTTDDGGAISKWRSLLVDNETKTSSSSLDAVRYTNTTTTTTATDTDFGTWMTDSMRPLLANQKVDLDAANFGEVKDFSAMFDTIGRQILAVKLLLGNKDTDGSLIKELSDSCKLQCSTSVGCQ